MSLACAGYKEQDVCLDREYRGQETGEDDGARPCRTEQFSVNTWNYFIFFKGTLGKL